MVVELTPKNSEQQKPKTSDGKLWVRDEGLGNIVLPQQLETFVIAARLLVKSQYSDHLRVHKVHAAVYDRHGLKTDVDTYLGQGPSANSPESLELNIRFASSDLPAAGIMSKEVNIGKIVNQELSDLGAPREVRIGWVMWDTTLTEHAFFGAPEKSRSFNRFGLRRLSVYNCHNLTAGSNGLGLTNEESWQEQAVYVFVSMADNYRKLQDAAKDHRNQLAWIESEIRAFEKVHHISPPLGQEPEPYVEQSAAPEYTQRRGEY